MANRRTKSYIKLKYSLHNHRKIYLFGPRMGFMWSMYFFVLFLLLLSGFVFSLSLSDFFLACIFFYHILYHLLLKLCLPCCNNATVAINCEYAIFIAIFNDFIAKCGVCARRATLIAIRCIHL